MIPADGNPTPEQRETARRTGRLIALALIVAFFFWIGAFTLDYQFIPILKAATVSFLAFDASKQTGLKIWGDAKEADRMGFTISAWLAACVMLAG